MSERTSLDRQISCVDAVARNYQSPDLREAHATLCRVKRLRDAVYDQQPDQVKVEKLLEELLLGS